MSIVKEFKAFAMRGNVVDMAVGVIIGGAFGKITGLKATIGESSITYGNFIQNVVDFLIIAFCIFMMIKGLNKLSKKKEEEKPAEPPAPSKEEILLTEIRDLLKENK